MKSVVWLALLLLLAGCGPSPNDKKKPGPEPVVRPSLLPVAGNGRTDAYPGDGALAVDGSLQPAGPLAVSLNNTLAFADRDALRLVPATTGTYYGADRLAGRVYTLPAVPGGIRSLAIEPQTSHLLIATPDKVYLLPQRAGSFWGQSVSPGQLTLLAGGGSGLDDVAGTEAQLGNLHDISLTPEGHLLIAAGCRVLLLAGQSPEYQRRSVQPGRVYTLAGSGCGSASDGTPAREAALGEVRAVVGDARGNLIFAEDSAVGGQLRMVPRLLGDYYGRTAQGAGRVYLIAGGGTAIPRNVPARTAQLPVLTDLALGPRGQLVATSATGPSLYLLGSEAGRFGGTQTKAGNLYQLGGTEALPLKPGMGVTFEHAGWVYLSTATRILFFEP